jgi:hypothetical protein
MHPDPGDVDRAGLALKAHAPLGPQAAEPAAPGARLDVVAEARKALRTNTHPPNDPGRLLEHTGIVDIGIGNVLNPAGQPIEANTPARSTIGEPRPKRVLENTPDRRQRKDLAQLHR